MEYADLPVFRDFRELEETHHFVRVPEDWHVVITDVVGSTEATRAGRYRSVNALGVGSIVAAQRAVGDERLPFSFGGDGATILVPERHRSNVVEALRGLKALARDQFDLELRVGAVAARDLYGAGCSLEVGRYEVVPGQTIAMFRGSGYEEADRRIRAGEAFDAGDPTAADLEGMSCRWRPIPAHRGKILSIILQARTGRRGFYSELLRQLDGIVEGGIEASNPVRLDRMSYRSLGECLRDELRYHARWSPALFGRLVEILIAVAIFRLGLFPRGLPGMPLDARAYARSLARHTDYRKFDNVLRMTLDCTESEAERIEVLFQRYRESGDLLYGTHSDDEVVMTCFLADGLGEGEHLHFVDGGGGGYSLAAVELKEQIQQMPATARS